MKKVLIIGKDSYIGEHTKDWLERYPNQYQVEIVSPLNHLWKNADFKSFDVVINVAGIAHIKHITEDMKDLFYSVNRDLAIEIARYSKESGVRHLVHFSSMNVYGDFCDNLTVRNQVHPTSFYGDSKLQGDKGIRKFEDDSFKVAYIRPPFVYGKGCKGNYNTIRKIALKTPLFPTYKNKKSMIYIDNICEFVRLVIDNQIRGVLTPQNKELVSTAELIKEIAICNNKKVVFTGVFNWSIWFLDKINSYARKAFSDDCYAPELSKYWDNKYCVVNFKNSIIKTEM